MRGVGAERTGISARVTRRALRSMITEALIESGRWGALEAVSPLLELMVRSDVCCETEKAKRVGSGSTQAGGLSGTVHSDRETTFELTYLLQGLSSRS